MVAAGLAAAGLATLAGLLSWTIAHLARMDWAPPAALRVASDPEEKTPPAPGAGLPGIFNQIAIKVKPPIENDRINGDRPAQTRPQPAQIARRLGYRGIGPPPG